MRYSTRVVVDMETMQVIERDLHEWDGPVEMAKSGAQKETERNQLSLQRLQMTQAQQAQQEMLRRLGLDEEMRKQILEKIQPYLDIGQQALGGQVPQGLYNAQFGPAQTQITGGYDQARQNLFESLGASGGYGSGIGLGPMRSLETAQARDLGSASQQASLNALLQGLGLGQAGLGMLSGQQAGLNPLGFGGFGQQAASQVLGIDPSRYRRAGSGLLGSLASAGAQAGLGSLTGGRS